MRTTVDRMDNPRKSRTLHHSDVSYFSLRLCHQRHTMTDNNGPAEVNSRNMELRHFDSVNFLLTEFDMILTAASHFRSRLGK